MGDLRFAFVKVLLCQAQQVQGRCIREAGAGGVVPKDRYTQAAVEYFGGNVLTTHAFEGLCNLEHLFEFAFCLLPGQQEVFLVRI